MELAVWVLKHAADARLVPAAPAILAALLHLLDDGARPFYESIGVVIMCCDPVFEIFASMIENVECMGAFTDMNPGNCRCDARQRRGSGRPARLHIPSGRAAGGACAQPAGGRRGRGRALLRRVGHRAAGRARGAAGGARRAGRRVRRLYRCAQLAAVAEPRGRWARARFICGLRWRPARCYVEVNQGLGALAGAGRPGAPCLPPYIALSNSGSGSWTGLGLGYGGSTEAARARRRRGRARGGPGAGRHRQRAGGGAAGGRAVGGPPLAVRPRARALRVRAGSRRRQAGRARGRRRRAAAAQARAGCGARRPCTACSRTSLRACPSLLRRCCAKWLLRCCGAPLGRSQVLMLCVPDPRRIKPQPVWQHAQALPGPAGGGCALCSLQLAAGGVAQRTPRAPASMRGAGAGAKAETAGAASYPAAEAVVAFLRARQPRLAAPADAGKPLALPARAFVALVAFLRRCRAAAAAAVANGGGGGGGGDADMADHGGLPLEYLGAHACTRVQTLCTLVRDLRAWSTRSAGLSGACGCGPGPGSAAAAARVAAELAGVGKLGQSVSAAREPGPLRRGRAGRPAGARAGARRHERAGRGGAGGAAGGGGRRAGRVCGALPPAPGLAAGLPGPRGRGRCARGARGSQSVQRAVARAGLPLPMQTPGRAPQLRAYTRGGGMQCGSCLCLEVCITCAVRCYMHCWFLWVSTRLHQGCP